MRMTTLSLTTAMILALGMGSAQALEANTSTQATTTVQAADGTWSDVEAGVATLQPPADIGARIDHFLQAPARDALSSNVTGGALNSTTRARSSSTLGTTADLGVNTEVGTRNQRAGVRAGSSTGVGLGGNAGVGIGTNR